MSFELPNGKKARNLQEQVKFLTEKLRDLYARVNDLEIHVLVVDELPEEGVEGTIYLLPVENPEEGNYYEEYLWIDDAWEMIGTTQIDLSNYYTKEEIDASRSFTTYTVAEWTALSTADKVSAIKRGIIINGTLGSLKNPVFMPPTTSTSAGLWGFVIDGGIYEVNNLRIYACDTSSGNLTTNSSWKYVNLIGAMIEGKVWPTYPTDNASPKALTIGANGGSLGWGDYVDLVNEQYITGRKTFEDQIILKGNNINQRLYINVGNGNFNFTLNAVNYLSGDGSVLRGLTFLPKSNITYDLGNASYCWRNLYIKGDITDGTNSILVANIQSKLYKHHISLTLDNSAYLEFFFYSSSATAYTTWTSLAADLDKFQYCAAYKLTPVSDDACVIANAGSTNISIVEGAGSQASNILVVSVTDTVTAL